jgi:hypothetical protein
MKELIKTVKIVILKINLWKMKEIKFKKQKQFLKANKETLN